MINDMSLEKALTIHVVYHCDFTGRTSTHRCVGVKDRKTIIVAFMLQQELEESSQLFCMSRRSRCEVVLCGGWCDLEFRKDGEGSAFEVMVLLRPD